jgi:hypothetical protein
MVAPVNIASDGTLSLGQVSDTGQTTDNSPVLAPFGGSLYVAWTGSGNNTLNVMQLNSALQLATTVYTSGATINGSPALAASGGQLYIAWAGQTNNNQLFVSTVNPGPNISVPVPVPLPETSSQSPALVDNSGTPVLAWIASGNNNLQVMPLNSNGTPKEANHIFSHDQANNGAAFDPLNGGPALDNVNGNLWIAWSAPNPGLNTNAVLYDAPVGFDLNAAFENAAILFTSSLQSPGMLQAFNGGMLVNSYAPGSFGQIVASEPPGGTTMTFDFSNGNFIPTTGLSFDGQGDSTLILKGGSFTNEVITPTGPTSGTITLDGALINYTGVAGIEDTIPVTNFTMDGTNSPGELVHFSNDPSGSENGVATAEINSASSTFTKVDYGNKTNVQFVGGTGSDTYTFDGTAVPANLAGLTVSGTSPGTDTFNVQATLPGIPTTIDTGNGTSMVNVAPGSTDLAHLGGALMINGGTGSNTTLAVTDPNAAAGQTYTLTSTTLQAQGGTLISYSSLQSLTLSGGPGNDTYGIQGTGTATKITTSSANLLTPNNSNTLNVGRQAPTAGGTLAGIQGALTILGGAKDTLTVDDTGDAKAQSGQLSGNEFASSNTATPTTLTGLGMGPAGITYLGVGGAGNSDTGLGQLNINLGSGGNTFTVQDTAFPTVTRLNTGSGNDSVLVQATVGPLNIDGDGGSDSVTLRGPVVTEDALGGPVTLADTGGMAAVVFDDSGDATAQEFKLTDNAVKTAGIPEITFQPSQISSLSILGGSGGNTFRDEFDTASVPPTTVNGGTGTNSFFGPTLDTTWAITGPGAGTLNSSLTFAGFQTLNAQSASGQAALDLSALTTSPTWNLTGNGAGSVAGFTFTGMNQLIGSKAGNVFTINPGTLFDSINGNGGTNTLDCTALNPANLTVAAVAADGSASGTAGFLHTGYSEITSLLGSTSMNLLTGPSNPIWNVTGPDAGTLNGSVSFSGFAVAPLAPTSVTLTSDHGSGSTYGQTVTLIASVSSLAGVGTPTGNVQFVVAGNTTTVPLSNGSASLPLSNLPAGTDNITANYVSDTTNFANSSTASPLLQAVAPAPLTITADDQNMVAGAALPVLTASYSGFVNGDTSASLTTAPSVSTTATASSPTGTYPITPSGAVDVNYAITYVPGTLTITPSPTPTPIPMPTPTPTPTSTPTPTPTSIPVPTPTTTPMPTSTPTSTPSSNPLPTAALTVTAPHQLIAHGGMVAFKGQPITVNAANSRTLVTLRLSTSRGQFRLHPSGVKITGNSSRTLTLTGTVTAVNQVLSGLSLALGQGHRGATVSVTVSDGRHSNQSLIKIGV